jgi:hypothetical protein
VQWMLFDRIKLNRKSAEIACNENPMVWSLLDRVPLSIDVFLVYCTVEACDCIGIPFRTIASPNATTKASRC